MSSYTIKITLLSDTTFGTGDGIVGLIDQEVEYDQYGLRGRTLKGLLCDECDTFIAGIESNSNPEFDEIRRMRDQLFGVGGSVARKESRLHFSDAILPLAIQNTLKSYELPTHEILNALTVIRRQTAIENATGVAKPHSLRSQRAVIHGLTFESIIDCKQDLEPAAKELLDLSCRLLRRLGTQRNRGRGRVKCCLIDHSSANQHDRDEHNKPNNFSTLKQLLGVEA